MKQVKMTQSFKEAVQLGSITLEFIEVKFATILSQLKDSAEHLLSWKIDWKSFWVL